MSERQSTIERARARDAGIRRLRRLTVAGVAAATALAGLFSGLAAKAVPGRTTPTTGTGTQASSTTTTTTLPAASDPIVPATGSGSSSGSTPQAPAQTPSTTQAPPVVSSGGS